VAREARGGSIRNIIVNVGWLLSGKAVAAVLSLLYIAIITRTLGREGYGQFALIIGTAQTITSLVSFQTWQVMVRYGMPHLHEGRSEALARLVKAGLALDAAAALTGALLAILGVSILGPRFGWSPEMRSFALLFCFVSLLAVRSTAIGVLRLHDQFNIAAAADTAMPVARLMGALAAMLLMPRVAGFVVAWIVADVIAASAFWFSASRPLRRLPWRSASLRWAVLSEENPGLLKFAGITNAGQTFTLVGKQVSVLLVGLFASPAAAGGFRLAHQLGQAMAKVGQLLAMALFPEFMKAKAASRDPAHFRGLLARTVRIGCIAGAVILALLFFAGKPLLELIAGKDFVPFYPLLLLLGTAAVLDFIGVGLQPALVATDRAGTAFRIQLFVALLILALLFLLLPMLGAQGGGIALLVSSAVGLTLMGSATYRALRRRDPEVSETDAIILEGAAADVDQPERNG
jgi:O-antigen/teichoic acid export membrane protein